jgi:serine/threonine-protein kinase
VPIFSVVIALAAVVWAVQRKPAAKPPAPVVEKALPEVKPSPPAEPEPPEVKPEPPAAVVETPKAEEPTLELMVEPSVELTINGKSLGRSPYSAPMAPGKYVVKLIDKSKGISTSRTVVVKASGKTSERIYLSKGFVSISAPDGAGIYIDGRMVGRAPIKEISVYEGSHHILVTVGKAKWQQSFSVKAHERMYFNVETE